jgi:hypothetical protein
MPIFAGFFLAAVCEPCLRSHRAWSYAPRGAVGWYGFMMLANFFAVIVAPSPKWQAVVVWLAR